MILQKRRYFKVWKSLYQGINESSIQMNVRLALLLQVLYPSVYEELLGRAEERVGLRPRAARDQEILELEIFFQYLTGRLNTLE